MPEFTALYPSITGGNDLPFSLHRKGCKDIEREARRRGASTEHITADRIADAVAHIIDEELEEMGYSAADVKVHNCCKANHPKSKEDTTMARTARKSTPAKKTTARKSTPKATEQVGRKKHDDAALTEQVVARHVDGDESLGAVAKDLGITPGKAAFLILMHEADKSPKLRRKAADDAEAATVILEMRNDEHQSWGQIAARLFVAGKRISEPKIKRLFDEAGGKRDLVTKVRKGDEEATPAPKTPAKRSAKQPAKTAGKTPARRTRKAGSRPS